MRIWSDDWLSCLCDKCEVSGHFTHEELLQLVFWDGGGQVNSEER